MKSTHNKFLICFCIITMFFIGITIYQPIVNHNAISVDTIINLVCIGLMVIVVIFNYMTGLKKTLLLSEDLFNAISKLHKNASNNNDDIDEIKFNSLELQNAFLEYRKEIIRTQQIADDCYVDISDYINYELLDRIIKKEYSEQISGAMTGLGILGTFIGLTFGLNEFNLGSDINTEEMMISISGLMGGIKTAFMTSIYGVVYSLVVNQFYKHMYCEVCELLNEFYNEYQKIVPSPQNNLISNLIHNQESQNQMLHNFSDEISAAIANQLNSIVKPTLDYFNTSIDKFIDKSVVAHNEGLDSIVTSFIESMNNSLGDQFSELGTTLSNLNSIQIENSVKLQNIVDDVCQRAIDIKSVGDLLEKAIKNLSEYTEKIAVFQQDLNTANEKIYDQIQVLNGFSFGQITALNQINDQNKDLSNMLSETTILINKFISYTEEIISNSRSIQIDTQTFIKDSMSSMSNVISESLDTISSYSSSSKEVLEQFVIKNKEALDNINSSSENQNQIILETFNNAINESGKILEAQMQEAENISAQIEKHIKNSAEFLNTAYKKLDGDIENVLKRTFESFDEELSLITSHLSGTIDKMDEYMQDAPVKLYTVIEDLIKEIQDTLSIINDLKNSNESENENKSLV